MLGEGGGRYIQGPTAVKLPVNLPSLVPWTAPLSHCFPSHRPPSCSLLAAQWVGAAPLRPQILPPLSFLTSSTVGWCSPAPAPKSDPPPRSSLAAQRVGASWVRLDVHGGEEVLEAVVAQVPDGGVGGGGGVMGLRGDGRGDEAGVSGGEGVAQVRDQWEGRWEREGRGTSPWRSTTRNVPGFYRAPIK